MPSPRLRSPAMTAAMITLGCSLGVQLKSRLEAAAAPSAPGQSGTAWSYDDESPKKTADKTVGAGTVSHDDEAPKGIVRANTVLTPKTDSTALTGEWLKRSVEQYHLTDAQRQTLQTQADQVNALQSEVQTLETSLTAQQQKYRALAENLSGAKAQLAASYEKYTGASLGASQWKVSSTVTDPAVTKASYDDESPKKTASSTNAVEKKLDAAQWKVTTAAGVTNPGGTKANIDDESPKELTTKKAGIDDAAKKLEATQWKLSPAAAGLTSAKDAGLRDPSAFPRAAGLVRKDFSSNSDPSRLNETANYSADGDFDTLVDNATSLATAAGWKEMSRSESGASATDRTTMILWERGNVKVDQRFYARSDGKSVYLQVSTDRTKPATP